MLYILFIGTATVFVLMSVNERISVYDSFIGIGTLLLLCIYCLLELNMLLCCH